ncbi:MAG TPA: SCP2 sterol-binding domain-containing protein [Pseudonocardiaceae bacterium]|nr:SCP2 sterol-binding domain-containing protein [Pseudonocardiaceae bacterium]
MTDVNSIDPRNLSTAEFTRLLTPTTDNDIGSMEPRTFARLIKHASAEQLDAVLGDPRLRRAMLDRIFSRMAGQFCPENAPARDSAIHWRLTGASHDDEVYETWITGTHDTATPQCATSKEPSHDPRVTLTMSGEQFLKLVSGNSSPAMMFITGKVKLDGDIGFAAALSKIFDMPAA